MFWGGFEGFQPLLRTWLKTTTYQLAGRTATYRGDARGDPEPAKPKNNQVLATQKASFWDENPGFGYSKSQVFGMKTQVCKLLIEVNSDIHACMYVIMHIEIYYMFCLYDIAHVAGSSSSQITDKAFVNPLNSRSATINPGCDHQKTIRIW